MRHRPPTQHLRRRFRRKQHGVTAIAPRVSSYASDLRHLQIPYNVSIRTGLRPRFLPQASVIRRGPRARSPARGSTRVDRIVASHATHGSVHHRRPELDHEALHSRRPVPESTSCLAPEIPDRSSLGCSPQLLTMGLRARCPGDPTPSVRPVPRVTGRWSTGQASVVLHLAPESRLRPRRHDHLSRAVQEQAERTADSEARVWILGCPGGP